MFDSVEHDENENMSVTVLRLYAIQTKYVVAVCVLLTYLLSSYWDTGVSELV